MIYCLMTNDGAYVHIEPLSISNSHIRLSPDFVFWHSYMTLEKKSVTTFTSYNDAMFWKYKVNLAYILHSASFRNQSMFVYIGAYDG